MRCPELDGMSGWEWGSEALVMAVCMARLGPQDTCQCGNSLLQLSIGRLGVGHADEGAAASRAGPLEVPHSPCPPVTLLHESPIPEAWCNAYLCHVMSQLHWVIANTLNAVSLYGEAGADRAVSRGLALHRWQEMLLMTVVNLNWVLDESSPGGRMVNCK